MNPEQGRKTIADSENQAGAYYKTRGLKTLNPDGSDIGYGSEHDQAALKAQQDLATTDAKAASLLKSCQATIDAEKGKTEDDPKKAEEKMASYMREHSETGKYEYLVRGALLQCRMGNAPRRLNIPKCHGVYISTHPATHYKDCVVGDNNNIPTFGVCSITKKTCTPVIVGYWLSTYMKTKIVDNGDKNPADRALATAGKKPLGEDSITTGSFLVCAFGGIIEPKNSGQGYINLDEIVNAMSSGQLAGDACGFTHGKLLTEIGGQDSPHGTEYDEIEKNETVLGAAEQKLKSGGEELDPLGGAGKIASQGQYPAYSPSGSPHTGVDILVDEGTAVTCQFNGTVVGLDNSHPESYKLILKDKGTYDGKSPFGNRVLIELDDKDSDGNTVYVMYAHLTEVDSSVEQNGHVDAGSVIGLSGNIGNSTAPHLHFEVRLNNMNYGGDVKPYAYLPSKYDARSEEYKEKYGE